MNGRANIQINTLCGGGQGGQRCRRFVFVPVSDAKLFIPLLFTGHIAKHAKVNMSKITRGWPK